MNQRIKGFVIRLTEKELAELDKKVKQSGLSREAYVRFDKENKKNRTRGMSR